MEPWYAPRVRLPVVTLALLPLTLVLAGCPPEPCCTSDTDCEIGLRCVDAVCARPCATDDECEETEVCAATASSDRLGRFCLRPAGHPAGVCPSPTPPEPDDGGPDDDGGVTCGPDALEPNDAREEATPLIGDSIAHRDLSMCEGDEDWFAVDVAIGDRVVVELSFLHAEGDLDLFAYQGAGAAPIAQSTSTSDTERLDLSGFEGRIVFRVFGFANASNERYGFSFAREGEATCLDGNEPNDTRNLATPIANDLGFGTIAAGICASGDLDVYRVDHPSTAALSSEIRFTAAEGLLTIRLVDDVGATVATGVPTPVGQSLFFAPLGDSPHFLEVRGVDTAVNDYTLSWNLVDGGVCGDGVVVPPEECDDGNTAGGDGCSAFCTVEGPLCGNGVVTPPEQCDDGNNASGDGCSAFCTVEGALCGDGVLQPPEECEDGNILSGDGCSSQCTIEFTVCGDGFVQQPPEECDDGNATIGDGCDQCQLEVPLGWTCPPEYYGFGQCDCGCGVVDADCPSLSADECVYNQCPGGVPVVEDNNAQCELPSCGNGVIDNMLEQCDDGNLVSGDGCSPSCQLEPRCGNGVFEPPFEQCDDGNLVGGDGCSPICTNESPCGNGVLNPGEQCDDGNNVSGDGCSVMCVIELPPCGNGVLNVGEQCDDGNLVNGDGCSSVCTIEIPPCGNGVLNVGEQCDDGNLVNGDGCSAQCLFEGTDWTCNPAFYGTSDGCDCGCSILDPDCPSLSSNVCDFNNCPSGVPLPNNNPICTSSACGNGVLDPGEECDDGNVNNGDSCSSSCTIEFGFCGDGILAPNEQCDDGNTIPGDGCSQFCTVEFSFCGDGVVGPFEQCDDGNTLPGDGCSPGCTLEAPEGWTCPVFWYGDSLCDCGCAVLDVDCPSLSAMVCEFNNCPNGEPPQPNNNPQCQILGCGNGVLNPGEQCDDGNLANGDGCNINCQIEPECGNGVVESNEQCDDGNLVNGDGCSSFCTFEQPICGNGVVEFPFEQCDDGNIVDGDGCSSFCFFENSICGNGITEFPFEQCDDGNLVDGDGCSSFCFFENSFCGNGITEFPFEQCDDGNLVDGDGCSSFCTLENLEGWTCFVEWFGDGLCDCGCGITDVDCPSTSADVCQFDNCQPPSVVDPEDNSQCLALTCADDFFEDNDQATAAAAITPSTLTNAALCPNDPDFFVFDAPANTDVVVVLQYTAPPSMTLRVLRPGEGIIDTVSGGGGTLTIPFFSTSDGPVIVRVTGASAGQNVPRPYALTAIVEDTDPTCVDDALEENDEPPGAGPFFVPSTVDATSCASDPDFFTFVSTTGADVSVALSSATSTGMFFAVFSTDFTLLGTGTSNGQEVGVGLPGPGAFVVVVAGGAGDAYTLTVD